MGFSQRQHGNGVDIKLNEATLSVHLVCFVNLVYGTGIHVICDCLFCRICQNSQNAFLVTCSTAYIFFVISSLPSPRGELYSVGFMPLLLCDLSYIHLVCTVSAFQPNVLSKLYCSYTSNSPRLCRVLLLFCFLTFPHRKLTFHRCPFPCIFSVCTVYTDIPQRPCPMVPSLNFC